MEESQSDKWYKKIKSWDQFDFMFYAILTGSSSLRKVISNFALIGNKLAQCDIFNVPRSSTLSDSNAKRKSEVLARFYQKLYGYHKSNLSDNYLRMPKNGEIDPDRVEIFDSTTVTLNK